MDRNGICLLELTDSSEAAEKLLYDISEIDRCVFPGNIWGRDSFEESMGNSYDYLIAAVLSGTITAGFALLRCFDDAEVVRIAVRREYRRLGIGQMLLNRLVAEAKKRSANGIFLEVRSSNEAAVSMYRKAGFSEEGVRKNYYSAPAEDALIMRYTC